MIALLEDVKKAIKEEGRKSTQEQVRPLKPASPDKFEEHLSNRNQISARRITPLGFLGWTLILAAIAAAAFLAYRETYFHRQTQSRLSASEEARLKIEQAAVKIQQEMNGLQEELKQVTKNLEEATIHASVAKEVYETKIEQLKALFQEHQNKIQHFRTQIKLLRTLIAAQGKSDTVPDVASTPTPEPTPEPSPKTTEIIVNPSVAILPENEIPEPLRPAATGEVVHINSQYEFVVVSLGQRQGVKMGDDIQIYQQDRVIGRARVDRVYPAFSAASVLGENTLPEVQKGDKVRLLMPA